jgi:hypothetical protein
MWRPWSQRLASYRARPPGCGFGVNAVSTTRRWLAPWPSSAGARIYRATGYGSAPGAARAARRARRSSIPAGAAMTWVSCRFPRCRMARLLSCEDLLPGACCIARTCHPLDHVPPCLPSRAEHAPSGPDWLHEIKHDGFRIMARRNKDGVRLYTRNGRKFVCRQI